MNIHFTLLIYVMLFGLMVGNIFKHENQCMIWVCTSGFVSGFGSTERAMSVETNHFIISQFDNG